MRYCPIKTLEIRQRFKVQVVLVDSAEFLGLKLTDPQSLRCQYVEHLLMTIDYPVGRMPWELPLHQYHLPAVLDQDVMGFYEEVRRGLVMTSWMGEELYVSPSRGTWLLIHYYKGES